MLVAQNLGKLGVKGVPVWWRKAQIQGEAGQSCKPSFWEEGEALVSVNYLSNQLRVSFQSHFFFNF